MKNLMFCFERDKPNGFLRLVKVFTSLTGFALPFLLKNNDKTFLMPFQMRDNHLGMVKKETFLPFPSHCFQSVGGFRKHSIP